MPSFFSPYDCIVSIEGYVVYRLPDEWSTGRVFRLVCLTAPWSIDTMQ